MATLIPTFDKILLQKVKPEEGELHLLNFLDRELDDSFEVYFNPYMNGDRPDIVLMKRGQGLMIIEVKDYNLNSYELDERKNFVIKSNKARTFKSPVSQVLKYKNNLFELHIEDLLQKKIKDIRKFNMVSCAVYFHNATSDQINELMIKPYKNDHRYKKFLKYNIDFLGRDNLTASDLEDLLERRYLISTYPSFLFTDDIYKSIKRFLKPPAHLKEEGEEINYSRKQLEIIYESNKKQQRIKGVVGSGKTTVLAGRAVQAHKRTKGEVLILTFNITLKNFIRDKISKVREEFGWEYFVILNYHLFIKSQLNNLEIPIVIPENFNKKTEEEKDRFFEDEYFSNKKLFLENKERIKTFDVILIDEIQDYKRLWMEIIKECFLSEGGEYILFGDVKQNIYNNQTIAKDVSTNVRGVTELKNCFRSDFKIRDLAILYQKEIFRDKYDIDTFNQHDSNLEIEFTRNQQGSINYIYLPDADSVSSLYTIIHENAINKDVPPNDITILGNSIVLLRKFDAFYRYASNERTNTMFETNELVYRMGMNRLKGLKPDWLKCGIQLIGRHQDKNESKALNQLSALFTLHQLYIEYQERFQEKLTILCKRYNTTLSEFLNYVEDHIEALTTFKEDLKDKKWSSNLKTIRNNKKIHFYFNSGTIKISTIHSFKGWESETVFLILENLNFQMTFDEILYTGITRTRSNLILINYGNKEHREQLENLVQQVK